MGVSDKSAQNNIQPKGNKKDLKKPLQVLHISKKDTQKISQEAQNEESNSQKEFKNKISVNEYEKFDQYNLIYDHNILNKKQIRKLLSSCYSMYYLRYKWIKKIFFYHYPN